MKFVVPVVLAALLAAALPALADQGHGRGGGGGRGGEAHGGGYAPRGGGRWAGPGGPGGPVGGPPGYGRYPGGYPGVPSGPIYAAPPNAPAPYYREGQAEARNGVRTGQIKPLRTIIGQLQSRGGRILDADLGQGPGGQPVYRVVWASPDGRRVDYIIDARTGAILQGY